MTTKNPEIAKRAAYALLEREAQTGITTRDQLEDMDLHRSTFHAWQQLGRTPSGDVLRRMALAGYDVLYILTGRRTA